MSEQQEETPTEMLVPPGMPSYLRFKPEADTVQSDTVVQQQLAIIDRKLKTSNHLNPHQAMTELVMPAFLALYDWVSRSQRDLLAHVHDLAGYLSEGAGVDPDEVAAILADVLDTVDATVPKLPDADPLREKWGVLRASVVDFLASLDLEEGSTEQEEEDEPLFKE